VLFAGIETRLASGAGFEEVGDAGAERAGQLGDEGEGFAGEDGLVARLGGRAERPVDGDSGRQVRGGDGGRTRCHVASFMRCVVNTVKNRTGAWLKGLCGSVRTIV
jgi:hypothetical protein